MICLSYQGLRLDGHEGGVSGVAFTRDGRRIVSQSWDNTVRLWDAETGAFLNLIRPQGETLADIAVTTAHTFRAISRESQTVIETASSGVEVAWFPAQMSRLVTHPSGRSWCGSVFNHLYFVRLEGNGS